MQLDSQRYIISSIMELEIIKKFVPEAVAYLASINLNKR